MNKLIEIKNLFVESEGSTRKKNKTSIPLLHDVGLSIESGQVLGLVGESGCGKTMTALSILGLLPKNIKITRGEINFYPRDSHDENALDLTALSKKEMRNLRGNHITMIFQEPMTSLNPLMSVGEQMKEILSENIGLKGRENYEKCVQLLQSVNIPEPGKVYHYNPWRLSGGMRQRVMIAMALSCRPELIIADEPTTALDVTTQAQILDLFNELKSKSASSFLFVTHDLGVIAEIADRTAIIYAGAVVEECSVSELFSMPLHPYTYGLMRARQGRSIHNKEALYTIPGVVPRAGAVTTGCAFAPRCERASKRCSVEMPPLEDARKSSALAVDGHRVRCWRFTE
jgi:oligopeptide/dipeptide ABC transporter ATP-binding protein